MTDDNPIPAMFDHCARVYAEMLKRAEQMDIAVDDTEGPIPAMVYKGHLTGLFQDLNIANPYYTTVMKALKAMNCVDQHRRGGGAGLSQWILLSEPTAEGYLAYAGASRPRGRPRGKQDALAQRLDAALKRIDYIEKFLAHQFPFKEVPDAEQAQDGSGEAEGQPEDAAARTAAA